MSQSATQRTTGSTRFRGPTIITLRGAGSKGKDYTLGGVTGTGQGLDVGLSVQIPAAQTANAVQIEQPDGTVIAQWDASGNIAQSGVLSSVQAVKMVSLTAANIIAMYATPLLCIAAPTAGTGIIVDQIIFQMTATANAFTSGGVVTFQYASTAHAGGTLVNTGSVAASVVTAGSAGKTLTILGPLNGASGLLVPTDGTNAVSGLYISNATGAFATGTGTAKVWIYYSLVTEQ